MRIFNIKAGSIILWKKYNWFQRLWAWICCKSLGSNKAFLAVNDLSILLPVSELGHFSIYEPRNGFSKAERERLQYELNLWFKYNHLFDPKFDYKGLISLVNVIRPETIDYSSDLDDLNYNIYYKRIHVC